MRWIWIDRILELEKARRCVAIKNVSMAEDVLHDHFPAQRGRKACPVMPNSLIIEGMAQTAGILVGHARDFKEKVILAKIGKAIFTDAALPGHTIIFTAYLERLSDDGGATRGEVQLIDPADSTRRPLAQIDLLFSHIDHNRAGITFPEHNFVFTSQFMDLLDAGGFLSDQQTPNASDTAAKEP